MPAFPGGSISGAPKKRGVRNHCGARALCRAAFTPGLIGYFDSNGDATFSVAIRTLVQENGTSSISRSAAASPRARCPAREYEETLHKAVGMKLALEAYRAAAESLDRLDMMSGMGSGGA